MSMAVTPPDARPDARALLSKVPLVTAAFWIIKVLATTVGETAADFLAVDLNLGLVNTSYVMGVLLVGMLIWQFRSDRYLPYVYWPTVVLISIVGTLITDQLVDDMGVSLVTCTVLFAGLLAATFAAWYRAEGTLSIHSIFTARREAFYWAAILFTFALGTAAGDLLSEGVGLGYGLSGIIIGGLIVAVGIAYRVGLDPVLSFWIAYILTRPLGASMGDLLSQAPADGGLGLGTVGTSGLFLAVILALVAVLTVDQRRHPLAAEVVAA